MRGGSSDGRSGGIRTHDPLTPSQVRYQAALRSDIGKAGLIGGAPQRRNLKKSIFPDARDVGAQNLGQTPTCGGQLSQDGYETAPLGLPQGPPLQTEK